MGLNLFGQEVEQPYFAVPHGSHFVCCFNDGISDYDILRQGVSIIVKWSDFIEDIFVMPMGTIVSMDEDELWDHDFRDQILLGMQTLHAAGAISGKLFHFSLRRMAEEALALTEQNLIKVFDC